MKINYKIILILVLTTALHAKNNNTFSGIVPNGLTLHPTYQQLKGFKRAKGAVISYVDLNNKSESQKDMYNFYYSRPRLSKFSSYKLTQLKAEWENRSYGEQGSYTSAAFGVNRLIIGNTIKGYMNNLGTNAKHSYKPYLEFRMGYKLADQSLFGLAVNGQLSYTVSDDYRFKNNLPNGYHKIPLKGFKADISFRF